MNDKGFVRIWTASPLIFTLAPSHHCGTRK
jgi:hypothetical protein